MRNNILKVNKCFLSVLYTIFNPVFKAPKNARFMQKISLLSLVGFEKTVPEYDKESKIFLFWADHIFSFIDQQQPQPRV